MVSVVMSVFNGEAFLAEALESVLDQTFLDFEFLVVDDGSRDGTAEILRTFADRDRRIRILDQDNRGLAVSLSRGVSEACGRYVARMDADDICLPDRFARQVAFLDRHPAVGVVGGAVQQIDSDGKPQDVIIMPTESDVIRGQLARRSPIAHPTAMIRRDLLAEVGAYRSAFRYAQDYDLWLRIGERAEIANLPDIVLRYRVHDGNVSRKHLLAKLEAVLLARASARARGRGAEDPADGLDGFPGDFIDRCLAAGESQGWIDAEAGPVMAARMAVAGDPRATRRWISAVLSGDHRGQVRRMLIEHLVGAGRRSLSLGRIGDGLRFLGYALRLRPSRALKSLVAPGGS